MGKGGNGPGKARTCRERPEFRGNSAAAPRALPPHGCRWNSPGKLRNWSGSTNRHREYFIPREFSALGWESRIWDQGSSWDLALSSFSKCAVQTFHGLFFLWSHGVGGLGVTFASVSDLSQILIQTFPSLSKFSQICIQLFPAASNLPNPYPTFPKSIPNLSHPYPALPNPYPVFPIPIQPFQFISGPSHRYPIFPRSMGTIWICPTGLETTSKGEGHRLWNDP